MEDRPQRGRRQPGEPSPQGRAPALLLPRHREETGHPQPDERGGHRQRELVLRHGLPDKFARIPFRPDAQNLAAQRDARFVQRQQGGFFQCLSFSCPNHARSFPNSLKVCSNQRVELMRRDAAKAKTVARTKLARPTAAVTCAHDQPFARRQITDQRDHQQQPAR